MGGFGFLAGEILVVVVAGAGVDLVLPVIGHLAQGGGLLGGFGHGGSALAVWLVGMVCLVRGVVYDALFPALVGVRLA